MRVARGELDGEEAKRISILGAEVQRLMQLVLSAHREPKHDKKKKTEKGE